MDLEKKLTQALSSREKMIEAKAPKIILDLCDYEVSLLKKAIVYERDYLWVSEQLAKYERGLLATTREREESNENL